MNVTRFTCEGDHPAPMETYECYKADGSYAGKKFGSLKAIYSDTTNESWSVALWDNGQCEGVLPIGYIAADGCAAGECCPGDWSLGSTSYSGLIIAGVTDVQWDQQCNPGPGAGTVIGYIVLVVVIVGIIVAAGWYWRKRRGFSAV